MLMVAHGDGKTARGLLDIITAFQRYDPDVRLETIHVFLAIVMLRSPDRASVGLKEIERITGLSPGAVSRNTRTLSDKHWKPEKLGYGLVKRQADIHDARETRVTLTALGERLYDRIKGSLNHK